jgi:hypothetical protein
MVSGLSLYTDGAVCGAAVTALSIMDMDSPSYY